MLTVIIFVPQVGADDCVAQYSERAGEYFSHMLPQFRLVRVLAEPLLDQAIGAIACDQSQRLGYPFVA